MFLQWQSQVVALPYFYSVELVLVLNVAEILLAGRLSISNQLINTSTHQYFQIRHNEGECSVVTIKIQIRYP